MLATDEQVNSRLRAATPEGQPAALIAGSGLALGSRAVPSEEVDRCFGMPIGKLRERAGIESLAYAADGETEVTLGAQAADEALRTAACAPDEIDSIIATSETHHLYPSLAAQLHSQIGVRENCGAFDVGGACLGLINALSIAQAQIASGQARTVAVVTSDLHSRTLVPGRVAGEFGGLFGDAASAFVVRAGNADADLDAAGASDAVSTISSDSAKSAGHAYRIRDFLFGCADQYAEAVKVEGKPDGSLAVVFEGEALSRAAISRLEKVIAGLEKLSAIPRAAVGAFATHQPNPRLLTLLAKVAGVSVQTFPPVATTAGNLGSSTCGAALHCALKMFRACPQSQAQAARKPIFLASLGPGLVFGGAWLSPQES